MISYSFGKIDEMITTYFIAKGLQSVVGSELSKNTENRGFETRRVQHIRWIWCQSYVRLFVWTLLGWLLKIGGHSNNGA